MKHTFDLKDVTFRQITAILGKDNFSMPVRADDCQRTIRDNDDLNDAKKQLLARYPNAQIVIDPDTEVWSHEVSILDSLFFADLDRFYTHKAAFCARYGCN